ncbi:hypothetical protein JHK82_012405 [Glycine max]|nr:hypothetical protein JHK85_012757 [Glycine max]KAG5057429.1 hypothetical protein JHK86_012425 [Glycine max]KAG5154436.1 hypothetical protein JHK82_012405 [Glycine max]
MAQYKGVGFGELSPHPFAVVDVAYGAKNLEDPSLGGTESPSRNSQGSNLIVSRSTATPKLSFSGMERSSRRMPSSGLAKCQKSIGFSTTQERTKQ